MNEYEDKVSENCKRIKIEQEIGKKKNSEHNDDIKKENIQNKSSLSSNNNKNVDKQNDESKSLKYEIEELKISNHEFDTMNQRLMSEYKQLRLSSEQIKNELIESQREKQQLQRFNDHLTAQNTDYIMNNKRLLQENVEYKTQNDELMKKYGELQLSFNTLHQTLKEMENRMNKIDPSRYLEWSSEDLTLWICSLDGGRYKIYKDKLLISFCEEGVDGACLHGLNQQELKGFGVNAFRDRVNIYQHIQILIKNNNDTMDEYKNILQQNEGQNDTNYMQ